MEITRSLREVPRWKKLLAGGVAVAATIGGLSGCSGSASSEASTEPTQQPAYDENYSDIEVKHVYTDSGKRYTYYGDPRPAGRGFFTDSIAYCDGRDMVEIPVQYNLRGGNSVITRSVGHGACKDSKLTPSDFGE